MSENFLDGLPRDSPTRVSKLAITSLVLSIVFCYPLTTIAGLLTGALAVIGTFRDRTLSGRWIAVVAIVISSLGTIGQIVVGVKGYNMVVVPILTGPQTALRSGESGDVAAFQECFAATASDGNTSENANVFLAQLKERYGAFASVALDTTTSQGGGGASHISTNVGQDFVADYQLDFAKGRVRATCAIEIASSAGSFSMKLQSAVIHDADKGDLRYQPLPSMEKP